MNNRWIRQLVGCLGLLFSLTVAASGQSLETTCRDVQTRLVKVYGAGGYQSLEGYQSGFFISADGKILTGWSYVLDPDAIRIVDHAGRTAEGRLLSFDPETEIALIQTELRPAAWFEIDTTQRRSIGTRVLAFSNLFNIAAGSEPASVQSGIIAGVGPLKAARRSLKVPYRGPVYWIDAMSNNPGSNGGALTDSRGNLLGMLGKELQDRDGQFYINYALPVDVLAERLARLEDLEAGMPAVESTEAPLEPLHWADVGVILVPRLALNTPPYVEWVKQDSAAWKAGLRPDDLLLKVQGNLVTSRAQAIKTLESIDRFATLKLTIRRDDQLKVLTIVP